MTDVEELLEEMESLKRECDRRLDRIKELNEYIIGKRPDLFHDSFVPDSRVSEMFFLRADCDAMREIIEDFMNCQISKDSNDSSRFYAVWDKASKFILAYDRKKENE